MPMFPSVRRDLPDVGLIAVKNGDSSAISVGACVKFEHKNNSGVGAGDGYTVNESTDALGHLAIGIISGPYNNETDIQPEKQGLCQIWGYCVANKAAGTWAIDDDVIIAADSGQVQESDKAILAAGAFVRGDVLGVPLEAASGSTGAIFLRRGTLES